MPIPPQSMKAQALDNINDPKFYEKLVSVDIVDKLHSTYPSNHGMIISLEQLEVQDIWSPSFPTMQHCRTNTSRKNFPSDIKSNIFLGENWQKFSKFTPSNSATVLDHLSSPTTGIKHIIKITKLNLSIKFRTIYNNVCNRTTIDGACCSKTT